MEVEDSSAVLSALMGATKSRRHRCVMTSRSSSWGNNEHIFKLEVGVFTEDEAMLFLTMNAAEFQQESIGEIKDTFWKTLHHLF